MIKFYFIVLLVYTILFALTAINATSLLLITITSIGAITSSLGCLIVATHIIGDYLLERNIKEVLKHGDGR